MDLLTSRISTSTSTARMVSPDNICSMCVAPSQTGCQKWWKKMKRETNKNYFRTWFQTMSEWGSKVLNSLVKCWYGTFSNSKNISFSKDKLFVCNFPICEMNLDYEEPAVTHMVSPDNICPMWPSLKLGVKVSCKEQYVKRISN